MSTVPELLRHDARPGDQAAVILRSGVRLTGTVEAIDLASFVLRLDGWALRIDEIAGVRLDRSVADAA
jgi:hypothetical protein